MAKSKKSKDEAEGTIIAETPQEDLLKLRVKYDQLIAEIKPHLLTKAQLKQGGSYNRAQYEKEKGFEVVLPEINALGKKLGLPKIGLGHLRA